MFGQSKKELKALLENRDEVLDAMYDQKEREERFGVTVFMSKEQAAAFWKTGSVDKDELEAILHRALDEYLKEEYGVEPPLSAHAKSSPEPVAEVEISEPSTRFKGLAKSAFDSVRKFAQTIGAPFVLAYGEIDYDAIPLSQRPFGLTHDS